jgi:hypothetical protein
MRSAEPGGGNRNSPLDSRYETHLAVGLGLKAIEHGCRVLFTTAAQMIATLTRALAENRLDERLKTYTVPRLLILDEIGYLPIDRAGANLVFQLIRHRPTHYVREFRSDRMDPGERTAPSLAWTGCSYSAAVAT